MTTGEWTARGSAKAAYGTVFGDFYGFLAQNALWIVVMAIITEGIAFLLAFNRMFALNWPINTFITVTMGAAIAVGWHRRILIDEVRTGGSALRFGLRELKFTFYMITIMVISYLPIGIFTFVFALLLTSGAWMAFVLLPIGFAITMYLGMRLTLGFPLIALERPDAMRTAWDMSKGYVWRFLGLAFMTVIPLTLAGQLISKLAGHVGGTSIFLGVILDIAFVAIYVVSICVGAAAFSFALRGLTNIRENASEPLPQAANLTAGLT
jgi:hypothetical protein